MSFSDYDGREGNPMSTDEAGKAALAIIEEAMGNAIKSITGARDEGLAKLLVAKLCGLALKLVERRLDDGCVEWTFEAAEPGGALKLPKARVD